MTELEYKVRQEIKKNSKYAYILLGEYIESHPYEEFIGVFSSYKKAIEEIEKMEGNKIHYDCFGCDTCGRDVTEKDFKEKKCPKCGNILEYLPTYDGFLIEKVKVDNSEYFETTLYECICNLDEPIIKERFNDLGEFTFRKPNTKIAFVNQINL